MDIHTRLEANAIIDRLVKDGPTFPADDARRLIKIIPIAPSSRISFKGSFKSRGSSIKGHAAGVGDMEMGGEAKEKTFALNVPTSHKIGGYIVTHTPGFVDIELMWGKTKADQTGQSCSLVYDIRSGEPQEMRLASQKSLTLLFITFNYISFVPWKKPEAS